MATSPSFEEQIRAYNEELRRYYAQSHPASHTETPKPEPVVEEAAEPAADPEPVPVAAAEETVAVSEGGEVAAPVERPWESDRVEGWMGQILRPETDASASPLWADAAWSDPANGDPVDPWASIAAFMEREGLSADPGADDVSGQAPPFGADPPQPVEPHADAFDHVDENSDIGYLQVRVFSARGAVPLVGAVVSVIGHNPTGQETLLHMNRTDQSGIAPQVSLPTPDRTLSLRPGDATPFLNYVVQVSAPGYATIRNEGVSVYGGITSLQSVPMIPLPEPQSDYQNVVVIRPGGAPPELN